MTPSRLAVHRPDKPGSQDRRRRHGFWRFLLIALLTGVLSAVIATFIAALPTLGSVVAPSVAPPMIRASSLFPSPAAVHKTVNVYDPVPVAAPRPTEPPEREHPNPSPSSEPRPSPSPTSSPTPGDE